MCLSKGYEMINIKESLVIIGNGFDIFHGIRSSYWDFKRYLEENKEHGFIDALESYISADELWCSFEYALGCLDFDAVKESNSCYLLGYGDDNWRDSAHHDYQMMISEELQFANDISKYLRDWILSLETRRRQIISNNVLNANNTYISFNYTDTLEQTYGIPRNNILYIHGKALENAQLIVGHGNVDMTIDKIPSEFSTEEEREAYAEYMEAVDIREQEAEEIIRNYFVSTYKNVDEIIRYYHNYLIGLQGIKQVYVLGHSLADVDLPYFTFINQILGQGVIWVVTYYRDYERKEFMFQLQKCGISWKQINFCKMEELQFI